MSSNKTIHFMAGLPRSGSTLLMNILGQHPDVCPTPTSGLVEVFAPVHAGWHQIKAHQASKELAATQMDVLGGILYNYHKTDKPVVIDKSRGWCKMIEALTALMGHKPKIIVCVRDITQIVASFEKLYRKDRAFRLGNNEPLLEDRVKQWLDNKGMVGAPFNEFKDALSRGHSDCLCIVEHKDLTYDSEATLKRVSTFLGLSDHDYDFKNVKQLTHEDDSVYGFGDLHTIRPEVKPVKDDSQEILGMELHKKLTGSEFWRK